MLSDGLQNIHVNAQGGGDILYRLGRDQKHMHDGRTQGFRELAERGRGSADPRKPLEGIIANGMVNPVIVDDEVEKAGNVESQKCLRIGRLNACRMGADNDLIGLEDLPRAQDAAPDNLGRLPMDSREHRVGRGLGEVAGRLHRRQLRGIAQDKDRTPEGHQVCRQILAHHRTFVHDDGGIVAFKTWWLGCFGGGRGVCCLRRHAGHLRSGLLPRAKVLILNSPFRACVERARYYQEIRPTSNTVGRGFQPCRPCHFNSANHDLRGIGPVRSLVARGIKGFQATWPVPAIPEIAWISLSSVTSSDVKVRMIRPEYIATIRSDTCSTSGISDEITITA